MTKQQLIKEIKNRLKYLETLDSQMAAQVKGVEGSLTIDRSKGHVRFIRRFDDKTRIYLNDSDKALITKLAQKRFNEKVMMTGRKERRQLKGCLKILESEKDGLSDVTDVLSSLPEEFKPLIRDTIRQAADEYARQWQDRKLSKRIRDEFIEKIDPLRTKRGEFVRSKSELIIANKLFDADVPYFYEVRKDVPGTGDHFFPDFLVLNRKTRKEYIWEHLGMLDNENYVRATQRKLSEYAKIGYFPGKNMIVTFESAGVPLDTEDIDILIREYLK